MEQISIRSKKIWTEQILNHLVDPGFQGVNILFVLYLETENGRTSHSNYYLPKVGIKDHNVMTDGKKFFDQPINDDTKTWLFVRLSYFKENYKMITIDLSKQRG